jgi:Uma2 family endonuclease
VSVSPTSAEDTALVLDPRRFSVEEYHRLITAGILRQDEHVELLEGVIVDMSPQGGLHADCIEWLSERLFRSLGGEYRIRVQLPLTLGDRDEPEPDIAVVPRSAPRVKGRHPSSALLVIEVAGGSLRLDQTIKQSVYSRHGVAEYWVVDVQARTIHVFCDPDGAGTYRRTRAVATSETLASEILPQVSFPVAQLFG